MMAREVAGTPAAEPLHEWACPSCGATTRARMADAPAAQPAPDRPHLVDAAAPAMRILLRRVELGQLSAASAVDILLDWPNRAGAGAPTEPADGQHHHIEAWDSAGGYHGWTCTCGVGAKVYVSRADAQLAGELHVAEALGRANDTQETTS